MATHPPDYHVVHPLPTAPQFVGRRTELDELLAWWYSGISGVVALVGLGGAGKTAVAARLVAELCRPENPYRPGGLFVWSFYQEPDAGFFLSEAYRYFAGAAADPAPARGAGLLHLLRDALAVGGPHLLVLDGLERVQRQEGDGPGAFGQVEDPLLRGLLTRLAEGVGKATALVTTRFPLTDLEPMLDRGYRHRDVEGLDRSAALDLLRRHGVRGDDDTLAGLLESYGAHALTLDHLGGLIGRFLGGDPSRAPEAPTLASPRRDRQALRLARLLDAYQAHLPPAELALLGRLSLLRRSAPPEQVGRLFLCTPPVQIRTARDLEVLLRRIPLPDQMPGEFASELAASVRDAVIEAHQEAPIAGPEDAFVGAIYRGVEGLLEQYATTIEDAVEEVVRLYGGEPGHPTESRPLSWPDQEQLRDQIYRYNEYRSHPLYNYQEPPSALTKAFLDVGWLPPTAEDFSHMTPADVEMALRRARRAVKRLAIKHRALRLVGEQCRLHQRKWRSSGPLATLDAAAIGRALSALVDRHLVLREADGTLSVHPAVRDYFAGLTAADDRGLWHHLIGDQLISLASRPGLRRPEDQAGLDLVEEAIAHARESGRPEKAWTLYVDVLGGHRHLAWKLGEMARGLRILRGFDPCPDRWALGWYLRAMGELESAYAENPLPYFRADIRLLQGRLPDVEAEGDPGRSEVAAFLMGRKERAPAAPLGCAIPTAQLLLYHGQAERAWLAAEPEGVYELTGWNDDRARGRLYVADACNRLGHGGHMARSLEDAARWVLHSGSMEHLCVYHLVRARIARRAGDASAARSAIDEGLHVARQCEFRLYQVELLCEQAELQLAGSCDTVAVRSARAAHELASSPDCLFVWGAAAAGHLLGVAMLACGRVEDARRTLEATLSTRRIIGDFRVEQTEALLRSIRG
jgi:hypothetical protein